jgi:hypothetical protein
MTDRQGQNEPLERPKDIDGPDGLRRDGRPTSGATDDIESGRPADATPTVAPEEKGGTPSTEHAPGGDL